MGSAVEREGMKSDPVEEANKQFPCRRLQSKIFLNAVPKCGTVLLRNIILMFVPWDQYYCPGPFVTTANLSEHVSALTSDQYKFFVGHMNHTPVTSQLLRSFKHILIIRDPHQHVLSYARWFFTKQMYEQSKLAQHIQDHNVEFDEVVGYVIRGWSFKGESHPNVNDAYLHNAVSWFGSGCKIVKYETILQHVQNIRSAESEQYFTGILRFLDIDIPPNWRDRVLCGSDPRIARNYSPNLPVAVNLRRHLLDHEKQMFSLVAPRLREILGYAGE